MPITAGTLIGGIGAIGKMFTGFSQNKMANQIQPTYTPYQKSPYASQYLGLTQNLFNSRMPNAANMESNIRKAQANAISKAQRNASDSSTLLAVGAAGQGQANQAYSDLLEKEGQFKIGMLGQLGDALKTNISEGDKEYKDMLMKYQLDTQSQSALRQSGISNIFGGLSDISGGMMQSSNYKNASIANKNASNFNDILRQKYFGNNTNNQNNTAYESPSIINPY